MSKLILTSCLSLACLTATGTATLAQNASASSDPGVCTADCQAAQTATPKKNVFPGLKLEPWDDKPAATIDPKPAPLEHKKAKAKATPSATARATTAPKKGGLFSGLTLEPWKKAEAQPADAKTAAAASAKTVSATDAKTAAEPKKAGLFAGLRLEPWNERADAPSTPPKVASTDGKKTSLFGGFRLQPWNESDAGAAKADDLIKPPVDEEGHAVIFPGAKLEPWR
jgi:hypothetical protein